MGVGDLIVVKRGRKVPLDGEIVEGNSRLLIHRHWLVDRCKRSIVGESVLSGFINKTGFNNCKSYEKFFWIYSFKDFGFSSKIQAEKKSKQRIFITKFARYCSCNRSIDFSNNSRLFLFTQPFSNWVYRALTFLVVSCPCAFGYFCSVEAVFGGIGGASKHGILVKVLIIWKALTKIDDTVVMDKTGTFDKGIFKGCRN